MVSIHQGDDAAPRESTSSDPPSSHTSSLTAALSLRLRETNKEIRAFIDEHALSATREPVRVSREIRDVSGLSTACFETVTRILVNCSNRLEDEESSKDEVFVMMPVGFPREIVTTDCWSPNIARIFMNNTSLRVVLAVLWVCSFFVASLIWSGIVTAWWANALTLGVLPDVFFITSCFNRDLFLSLCKNFQTIFFLYNVVLIVFIFCILWRDSPIKIFSVFSAIVPSLFMTCFVDAYPESGRVLTSRTYFGIVLFGVVVFWFVVALRLGCGF